MSNKDRRDNFLNGLGATKLDVTSEKVKCSQCQWSHDIASGNRKRMVMRHCTTAAHTQLTSWSLEETNEGMLYCYLMITFPFGNVSSQLLGIVMNSVTRHS